MTCIQEKGLAAVTVAVVGIWGTNSMLLSKCQLSEQAAADNGASLDELTCLSYD